MQSTDFVESYFDAWNQHDPHGVADHLAPGGIYQDVRQNEERTHDELAEYLREFFRQYRHRYELIGDILSNGNTVAFQYRMVPSRRHRSGETAIYQGAEFITLEEDSAALIADYYDVPDAEAVAIATPSRTQARRRKYAKSGLSEAQLKKYRDALQELMYYEELYLDPGLTLPKLAGRMSCSVNHLSQVINAGFGMSFFDYINQHRVEQAKKLLAGLDDRAAVLKVAYSVGFNSNSAFYTAFKKRVGMTPAQFRRCRTQ